jgi:hypothetical protein
MVWARVGPEDDTEDNEKNYMAGELTNGLQDALRSFFLKIWKCGRWESQSLKVLHNKEAEE